MGNKLCARALCGTVALIAIGCSADSSAGAGSRTPTSLGPSSSVGSQATGSTSGAPTGGNGFGNSTTVATGVNSTIRNPGAAPGATTTTVTSSFIWIANSAEGTVSKVDTRTLMELGRYLTTQNGKGLPSRTSVGSDGSVAVANRSNATGWMGGDGGGVIKIYASMDKCQDKNGNGVIDTSTGAKDVKPWGQDECVAWFTPINQFSNRPVSWAPAPGPDIPAKVWTSAASNCTSMTCAVDVYRLNGDTGAIEDTVNITGLTGVDFISSGFGAGGMMNPNDPLAGLLGAVGGAAGGVIDNYGAYGGASDGGGNFWLFIANTTQLVRVDALTLQWRAWPIPMGNGYGITIEGGAGGGAGRIFICGTLGLSRFDPSTESWVSTFDNGAMAAVDLGFNGCMTDAAGKIWVGGGSDQGTNGLFGFNADTLALVDQVSMDQMGRPMTVKGVSVDVDGGIWGVGSAGSTKMGNGNTAWRFDPATRMVASYDGLNGAYSYSDMTGFGLTHAGFKAVPLH
jgi:hypothetical protein